MTCGPAMVGTKKAGETPKGPEILVVWPYFTIKTMLAVSRAAGAAMGSILPSTAQCGPPAVEVTHWGQRREEKEGEKGERNVSARASLSYLK